MPASANQSARSGSAMHGRPSCTTARNWLRSRPGRVQGPGWPVSATMTRSALSPGDRLPRQGIRRSEEHTSELQSLMRISYAVFCLKKKKKQHKNDKRYQRDEYHTISSPSITHI